MEMNVEEKKVLKRGRPRTFDRDVALEKAMFVFWEKGYEGTTMTDLIAAIGMKAPSIYAAFGDKDALFKETVGLYIKRIENGPVRVLNETENIVDAIEGMLKTNLALFEAAEKPVGCLVMTSAINCSPEHHHLVDDMQVLREHYKSAIQQKFEQAITSRQLKTTMSANLWAEYFLTVIQGLAIRARDGVPTSDLQATAMLAIAPLRA